MGGWNLVSQTPSDSQATPPPSSPTAPSSTPATPPPSDGGASGGWKLVGQSPATTSTQPPPVPVQPSGLPEQVLDTMGGMGGVYGTVAGAVRGAVGTAAGLGRLAVSAAAGSGTEADRHFKFLDRMKNIAEGGTTPEEKTGKVMEGLAEFAAGDAALKGLSYVEKLQKVMPFLKVVEGDPALLNAVRRGIVAGTEGGIVGGGVTTAQTGDVGQGLKAAAIGATGAGVLGGAAELTPAAARAAASKAAQAGRAARERWTGETAQAVLQSDLMQGMRGVFKGVAQDRNIAPALIDNTPSVRDVGAELADALREPAAAGTTSVEQAATAQNNLQSGIRSVIRESGKEGGLTVEEPQSIRDAALKLSDALHDKAKGLYQQLDTALEGRRFQNFGENIRNIQTALRSMSGTDPDREGLLVERLNDENKAMQQAIEELKAKGVDPGLVDQASAAFRQHKGAEELSDNIRKSTRGLRPELRQAGQEATPETVHAEQLSTRVNAMYNNGTLQDVLGENRAQDLLRHVDRAEIAMPKTPAALSEQSDALEKVTSAIRKNMNGLRPQDITPGREGTPETLEIQGLFKDLRDLHDDGVLEKALGYQRARDLINEVDAAKIRADDIVRRVNRVKTWAKVGAGAAGVGVAGGWRTAEHLLEGKYYNR